MIVLAVRWYLRFVLSPAKVKEGTARPDRDGQFRYLHGLAAEFTTAVDPVISVDTKRKEMVGEYANGGVEWQPGGRPVRVNVHDFVDPELGRAIPYGIDDETNNEGWVSVGDVADTAEFAVNAIRSWWNLMGRTRFPDATRLLITADGGGSNGHRVRLWKAELAKLAAETGLEITVCHYPPGTSKWNRIEHRMFSYITMNWRGRPLTHLPPHHHRTGRRDHHRNRAHHQSRTRHRVVSEGRQDQRHRHRLPTPHPTRLARRLELHTRQHHPKRLNNPAVSPQLPTCPETSGQSRTLRGPRTSMCAACTGIQAGAVEGQMAKSRSVRALIAHRSLREAAPRLLYTRVGVHVSRLGA